MACPHVRLRACCIPLSDSPSALVPAQITEELTAAEARRPAVLVAQPTLRLDLSRALQQAPARVDMCSACAGLVQKVSESRWVGGVYSGLPGDSMLVAVRLDSACWCWARQPRLAALGIEPSFARSELGHPSGRLPALPAFLLAFVRIDPFAFADWYANPPPVRLPACPPACVLTPLQMELAEQSCRAHAERLGESNRQRGLQAAPAATATSQRTLWMAAAAAHAAEAPLAAAAAPAGLPLAGAAADSAAASAGAHLSASVM